MTSSVITVGRNSQQQALNAARCSHSGKAFCLEMIRYQLARDRIIVNDKNAIGTLRSTAI